MLNTRRLPYVALCIALSTLVVSLTVNYLISGSLFGAVKVPQLEPYGGFTHKHIVNLELWRLWFAQLIHVKQMHMIYNVLSLLALGFLVERKMSSTAFLVIWLVSGSIGTYVSTFTVPEPWNLGTGGSQAILGIAAAALMMFCKGSLKGRTALIILTLTIFPAFALDLIFSENHLPKLGHVTSFSVGALLCYLFDICFKSNEARRRMDS